MDNYEITVNKFIPGTIDSLSYDPSKVQRVLRKELMTCNTGCLVTGWNNPVECECAHIIPKVYGHHLDFSEVNTKSNCCILSNGIHALFDSMQWTLDIYYFMDGQDDPDGTSFKARLVTVVPAKQCSIINNYKSKTINVPVCNFASFMVHYYAYHIYNYTGNKDLRAIYSSIWSKAVHRRLTEFTTVRQLKQYVMTIREESLVRAGNEVLYPITCLLGMTGDKYQVLWNYYPYSSITLEPQENIEETEAYDQYQQHRDPNYTP